MQPLVVNVSDKRGDFHGFDGRVAVEEEGSGLQDGEVSDYDFGDVGAFEVFGVGCIGSVGFGEGGDEGVEDGVDLVEDVFYFLGVDFGGFAVPVTGLEDVEMVWWERSYLVSISSSSRHSRNFSMIRTICCRS